MRKKPTKSSIKHLGIVACSAEGAALCYRAIVHEAAKMFGGYAHPRVTMDSLPFDEYMKHIEAGEWDAVGDMMAESAQTLVKAGAELIVCPDNTIHRAFDHAAAKTRVPWLHIAEVVAREAQEHGWHKLLILGTKYLMEGPVYRDKLEPLDVGRVTPSKAQRDKLNRIIFEELVHGVFKPKSIRCLVNLIAEYRTSGCDAVVLGCTEIPLVITPENSPLPVLDSTRLLARAAVKEAVRR